MIIIETNTEEHLQMLFRALRREWRLHAGREDTVLPDLLVRMVPMVQQAERAPEPEQPTQKAKA